MFAVADLIVIDAIESGLENLRNNPSHIDFILGKYEDTPFMRKLHGKAYVRQCKELILQNKIFIKPYYVLDLAKLPSVAVIAQYAEEIQVIGDYGMDQRTAIISPILLGNVKGVSWEITGYGLEVSDAASVTEFIYSGAYLQQDNFKSRIDYVYPLKSGQTCFIFCKDKLPQNRLIDWQVVTSESSRIATIHSTGNTANVSIDLKSCGDIEVHKLLALVIRYCLHKGRYLMDQNGLQITTKNQNFPGLFDEEQNIFQSVFSLQGKIWDSWIENEVNNDRYENMKLCATPPSDQSGSVSVGGFII
jgi:hypothetical protein